MLQPLRALPRNVADILDSTNTGQVCAFCMSDLSLSPESIVCNQEYSFNFCSELCLRSIQVDATFKFHENRNLIRAYHWRSPAQTNQRKSPHGDLLILSKMTILFILMFFGMKYCRRKFLWRSILYILASGQFKHIILFINRIHVILNKWLKIVDKLLKTVGNRIERGYSCRQSVRDRNLPVHDKFSKKPSNVIAVTIKLGKNAPGRGIKTGNKHKGDRLILLLSGDVETNPGPSEEQADPAREREDEPFDDSAGCVLWEKPGAEAFKQNRLHFNAVLANRLFKRELVKRLSNALFHCNCDRYQGEDSGLKCYKGLVKLFCASDNVSNEVIRLYNQVVQGELCFICLHNSRGERLSLVEGSTCSDLCEQALLDKFRECAGDYHSLKRDLVRGWNLMFRNKTELRFSCGMHSTSKVCLINSVDFESL